MGLFSKSMSLYARCRKAKVKNAEQETITRSKATRSFLLESRCMVIKASVASIRSFSTFSLLSVESACKCGDQQFTAMCELGKHHLVQAYR